MFPGLALLLPLPGTHPEPLGAFRTQFSLLLISVVEQDPISGLFSAPTILDSKCEVWQQLLAKKQQEPEIMATLV